MMAGEVKAGAEIMDACSLFSLSLRVLVSSNCQLDAAQNASEKGIAIKGLPRSDGAASLSAEGYLDG